MPELFPKSRANIVRMLDVSTAHLTVEERADLVTNNLTGQHCIHDHGGILRTSPWDKEQWGGETDNGSDTLAAIMEHALSRGCRFVLFDADAPELPGFPTFEE